MADTTYIGVVGGDHDYPECRDSIQAINRNGTDELRFVRATKGFEARQMHLNNFRASNHDWCLLLDHDQIFPPDTLTRLRAHERPYLSGYYMRRRVAPILPVWYEYPKVNRFPYRPWIGEPERGTLHRLGASGWGCILIHRQVVEAVRAILKGEPEVLEDDLDVWPYDLNKIMTALRALEALAAAPPIPDNLLPALRSHVQVLHQEIRPLRCKKDNIGSDIRFPFFAREAGYTLWGDPEVRCKHVYHYPLSPDDYTASINEDVRAQIAGMVDEDQRGERAALRAAWQAMEGKPQ
jgi:hypothetical protein